MKKRTAAENLSWEERQDELAEKKGLAIVLTSDRMPEFAFSNNNSICRFLYHSAEYAPACDRFCGKAFERAREAKGAVEYKCHAGLSCVAVPVEEKTVAIVGRAFIKAEDYRAATKRAIEGDWSKFPPSKLFENVLLTGSMQNLETLAGRLEKLGADDRQALKNFIDKTNLPEEKQENPVEQEETVEEINESAREALQKAVDSRRGAGEIEEMTAWRSLFGSLLNLSYEKAYTSILRFASKRYGVADLAWLERHANRLEIVFAEGALKEREIHLSIAADNEFLLEAVRHETSLDFREKRTESSPGEPQKLHLFPVAVGDEVWNALIVGDQIRDERTKRQIARFCHTVAPELEILRLRQQLARRAWLERAVQKFNESLKNIDSDEIWIKMVQVTAELLRAERGSLLILNEKSSLFEVKAATGARADIIKGETGVVGERVAARVLSEGKPAVVTDVSKIAVKAAPEEWKYKTGSFISYPITVGDRKIGVLNLADRADGGAYGENELELLDAIAPQLGVLIDRVRLKNQAGEFEQLSVTDSLTGLLNRRYLEQRLSEEIKRSEREGFPVSFMMLDVDYFKPYNDTFGHAEGDKALQLVAQCLRETLRSADVAARYGGEEFSILLPMTTPDEARIIGERIREKIASTRFPNRQVTVSIGIASCSSEICTPYELIDAADKALYEAKRRGRNNVQVYENLANGKGK